MSRIALGIFAFATVTLWIPIAAWLLSPDRTTVLGGPGHLLVIGSAAIQLVSILLGFVFYAVYFAWDDKRAIAGRRVFGWIAYAAGVVWAAWVCSSLLSLESGDIAAFGVLCALLLIPALAPMSRVVARQAACLVFAGLVLIGSAVLTAITLSAILIAPASVYVMAILVSAPQRTLGVTAPRGGGGHPGGRRGRARPRAGS